MLSSRIILTVLTVLSVGNAFIIPQQSKVVTLVSSPSSSTTASSKITLFAKKKKGSASRGKGFGKAPEPSAPTSSPEPSVSSTSISSNESQVATSQPLQSIETSSSNIPFMQSSAPSSSPPKSSPLKDVVDDGPVDPLEAKQRVKEILKQRTKRTPEEQKMVEMKSEQRQKIQDLTRRAKEDENFDVLAVLPTPLIRGIDTFLKLGAGLSTIAFVAAGIAITAEAWAAASGNPLPENVDTFIVNTVEPNFTPGLLVLLAFSVSLGLFASLQLGSASSQYKE